ncbi:hypothetical protein VP01_111g15 [Puccinia sorghi]|uniref:Uncharacterized protein n=1 Tax=Puccinia sorghi TaxID=27349 RepID=A0A0L6VSD7_9BASI|nr:hypothetical protein VP01_111g15 [Puccinia sorghi]
MSAEYLTPPQSLAIALQITKTWYDSSIILFTTFDRPANQYHQQKPTKKQKNVPSESKTKSKITPITSKKKDKKTAKTPSSFSQSKLDPSSSQLINLAQDSGKENANFKPQHQRRDRYLIISHQVPINICGARKNFVYLEAAYHILGLIVIALVKLEGYQMAAHSIKKPFTRVPSFLPLLFRIQKGLIKKHSTISYCCGFYFQQSFGTVLKSHIFELPFTDVNLYQSCLKRNGKQPLACNSLCFQNKLTLIHNMWTTKGNHFGFIGALVSFIYNDWNYVFEHISLKLVAWHHKGSFLEESIMTDSGSNNNTITRPKVKAMLENCLARQKGASLYLKRQFVHIGFVFGLLALDCDTMHIKCFCHKMALVVNAGFEKLGLEAPPPPKLKKDLLGSFPYSNTMKPIAREDE